MIRQQQGFGQMIVEILSSVAISGVQSNDYITPHASLLTDLMDAQRNCPQVMADADATGPQISPTRLSLVRKQFINMFSYDGMFDREAGLDEAHPDTLEWVFNTSSDTHRWCNFSQWIGSEDKLYWITGKMGSGKSTLMKYISEELPETSEAGSVRRCTPYLLKWARDQPLFIATFYFWAGSNEGTRIQTSVQGLYRTLLVQILQAYPESAPHVSPQRWENLCLFSKNSKPPAIQELKQMLSNAIKYVSSLAKVCLFIDGLDEFDGETSDLKGLVVWVEKLVETSPVKVCVASRPWRVFEEALEHRPHLLMEAFNFNDIQQYVWSRFNDDSNFRAKKQLNADFCNQLLDEIIAKAEGVFLWVRIVCTHLLEALSRGDLVGDLKRILNAVPVEMEKLYDHILDSLDLQDYAAKYFLLLQTCMRRPEALIFSFADDIGGDNNFSLNMPKASLTSAELYYRIIELRKRLNSRCRGLLSLTEEQLDPTEITVYSDMGAVQYCHRSAKDYLTMDTVQDKLIHMLDAPFDPHLTLCSAYLARWKCSPSDASKSERFASIYKCVEHAAKSANKSNDIMIRVLDDLDPNFDAQPYIDYGHFERDPWFGSSILSLTVTLGVSEYVECKVGQGQGCVVESSSYHLGARSKPRDYTGRSVRSLEAQRTELYCMKRILEASRNEKAEWPLLLDALLSTNQPNPEMVSLLLENGADANLIIRCGEWEKSALDAVLLRLRSIKDRERSDAYKAWVDSLCLLLRYGLKPHRSDVQFLRKFLGEDMIRTLKLPHLSRHRQFISDLLGLYYLGS